MPIKQIIRPDRLRRVPKQFSWIDHRLVRDRHIRRCGHVEWTLYLFLVTVGDHQGLSYYSDPNIQELLTMSPQALNVARQNLVGADLIAFETPVYQVLSLVPGKWDGISPRSMDERQTVRTHHGPEAIGQILRRLRGDG